MWTSQTISLAGFRRNDRAISLAASSAARPRRRLKIDFTGIAIDDIVHVRIIARSVVRSSHVSPCGWW